MISVPPGTRPNTTYRSGSAIPAEIAQRLPMPPARFKATLYAKGWSMCLLASHWDVSADYLRRIASNANRPLWWDDAITGLPVIGPGLALRSAWLDAAGQSPAAAGQLGTTGTGGVANSGSSLLDSGKRTLSQPRRPSGKGFRYWGYMVLGAVVAVNKPLGSIADEGMRGIVLQVLHERTCDQYRVMFETGELEVFTPDLVDEYLVTTGIERAALAHYVWQSESTAHAQFDAGMFVFEGA